MMRFLRSLLGLIKRLYDLAALQLLGWALLFALLAAGFYLAFWLALTIAGQPAPELFWLHVRPRTALVVRLVVFGALHLFCLWSFRHALGRLRGGVAHARDRIAAAFSAWALERPRARIAAGAALTLTTTALLIPLLLQPTLVPLRWETRWWVERAANLVDGSATMSFADSLFGLYRRAFARPHVGRGVSPEAFEQRVRPGAGPQPLIDRWDGEIWQASGQQPQMFALLKALVWVESGGRQFAVSRTGCVGLGQFCARTARDRDFHRIFGVGQVYPCSCDGPCLVPPRVQRLLESGDRQRISQLGDLFPCDVTDARFDAHKSLTASALYLRQLHRDLGGNIYLVYIGYNSGPRVAEAVLARLGRQRTASIAQIARHLTAALRPGFGAAARARARSLTRVHLPKLERAYRVYLRQAHRRMAPKR